MTIMLDIVNSALRECSSVRNREKLQERFRKVSFAGSEKLEIIVKPGQGAPVHRKQNLMRLTTAHEWAAPS